MKLNAAATLLLAASIGVMVPAPTLLGHAGDPRMHVVHRAGAATGEAAATRNSSDQLAVQYAFPGQDETDVATDATIMVQFNRPVALLSALARQGTGRAIVLDPPAAGIGRWLTSSLYSFRPEGLQPATTYTVRVPRDVPDQPGASLVDDYVSHFTTILPAVADESPHDNTKNVDPNGPIEVLFNQPVDHASAEAAFSLTYGSPRVSGSFSWPDERTLLFQSGSPLRRGESFEATVAPGVRGTTGTGASTAALRWHFTTAPVPHVQSTKPSNGEMNASCCSFAIVFSGPMDHDATEAAISIEPRPQASGEPRFIWFNSQLTVTFSMEPQQSYRLTVGTGARDLFGAPIDAASSYSFTVKPPDTVRPGASILASNPGVLSAYLPATVYIASTGLQKVELSLFSVADSEFRALASESPEERRSNAKGRNPLRHWTLPVTSDQRDEPVITAADLSAKGSNGALAPGYYLLLEENTVADSPPDTLVFEVTRTNLVVKRGVDSVLVWAADLGDGQPVAGASASIADRSGNRIASGTTSSDGTLLVSTPRPGGNAQDKQVWVTVTRADDVALATQIWPAVSPFSFGLPVAPYPDVAPRGYLYTDRPIYRAGETVRLRFVLRTDDDGNYELPSDADALTIKVSDARGKDVQALTASLDEFGSFGTDIRLAEAAATGTYSIVIMRNGAKVGSGTFVVAQFRVPEFEVKLESDRSDYVNGDLISASAQADLFLGAHLPGAGVRWTVTALPYSFKPAGPGVAQAYAGFTWADSELAAKAMFPLVPATGTGRTDAEGQMAFSTPAQLGDYPASARFTLTAVVTDQNQQQVSASREVVVHRAAVYAGARPRQYVTRSGEPTSLELRTVATSGTAAGGIAVQVNAYSRTWTTAKQQKPDGTTTYVNTPHDTLVDSAVVRTDSTGDGVFNFTPPAGGQYRITVQGADVGGNRFRTATSMYVTSSNLLGWRYDDQKVELIADRDQYSPGETAHVLVPAPFAGATGLVTTERGRIFSRSVQGFATNSTVIDVPITAEMAPNVYLSVALLKPSATADDPGAFRLGYLKLAVSPAGHALNVSLTPDRSQAGTGESVNVAVKTSDAAGNGVPAELSLAMVDQAVLSLADDHTKAIFDAFYIERPLGVGTGLTFARSVNAANVAISAASARAALARGPGRTAPGATPARTATPAASSPPPLPSALAPGAPGALPANGDGPPVSPVRTDFRNTAFWKSDVKTDANGDGTVTITMPDNLTTWQLSARGISAATQAGDAQATILTTRELVVRPLAPRFLTAGDHATLGTLVTNRGDHQITVTVEIAADGVSISGGPQRITVPSGESVAANWEAVAGESSPTKLTFSARADSGPSDAVALTLPVNDRQTLETVGSSGLVSGDSVQESVEIPGFARQDKGSLSITLNASLQSVLKQASSYLESYRYEPADVTAARLLDRVGTWQAAVTLQRPRSEQDDARGTAISALSRLLSAQNLDGGWSWWPASTFATPSVPEVTARVLYALGVAKRAGLEVSGATLSGASKYLGVEYDKPMDAQSKPAYEQRAFWLLAMSTAGVGSRTRDDSLAASQQTLADSGRAALLQALVLDGAAPDDKYVRALARGLVSTAVTSAAGTHWQDVHPDNGASGPANSTRTTALALLALLRLDPNQPLLEGAMRWLAGVRSDGYWSSINETSLAVSAVSSFIVAREHPINGLGFSVDVNGNAVGSGSFTADDGGQTRTLEVPLAGLPQEVSVPVSIARQGSGQLYYGLFMRYFTRTEEVSALSHGLTVSREVLPAEGDTAVDTVKAGDLVRVRLTILAPSDLQFVQVEDFLPAGLEAVDASLKISDPDLIRRQGQQRQDLLAANQTGGRNGTVTARPSRYLVNPFEHAEVRDDRVALFASNLSRGLHQYIYFARATTPGTFLMPPVVARETDQPDVFARGDSSTLTVAH